MGEERFNNGLRARSEALGAERVERAMAEADEMTRPFQELICEYCWGVGWTEGVLGKREKSLVTIAIVAALNRPGELETHLRLALGNGCSREEIADVLTHLTIYAGMPAGVDGFRAAAAAFAELDAAAAAKDAGEAERTG